MKQLLTDVIPKLSLNKHKGQDGRLCIVGGSLEYTGAPYFSGMSVLRCGADLVHIICDKQAAIPIKSLSPELMVAPYLDLTSKEVTPELNAWIKGSLHRMHSCVLGPGLGRDVNIMHQVATIIENGLSNKVPMVLDGDALWLLSQVQYRNLLNGSHPNICLTPNAMEFRRLWINHILKQDVNGKLDQNESHYLPPFDTTSLIAKLDGDSNEIDASNADEQKDDAHTPS